MRFLGRFPWTLSRVRSYGAPAVAIACLMYVAALVLFGPAVGTPIMALLLIPASLAGWTFGVLGGGLVSIGLVALNALLATTMGAPDGFAVSASAIPGDLMTLTGGVALGALREWQRTASAARLQPVEKLGESEEPAAILGASEQRFRLLAEEALVGVYLIQDGRFRYVNRAFADAFGYQTTEIIGLLGPDDLTSADDRELVRSHIETRLARGSGSAHYRFRGVRKHGGVVPVEVLGRGLQVDGRPAILGTLLNLTRQAQNEAALHLRLTALEAAPAGIVVTDPKAVIQWANPHALALTGYDLDEVLGEHTRLFNSGHQSQSFYKTLWLTISSGQVWRGELINRRKDGSEYLEEMSITPVLGPDGTIEHFVAVKQDVTQHRAAEESIRALNENLAVQLSRIMTLHQIDAAITDGKALDEALLAFLTAARAGLGIDALAVFLATDQGDALELAQTDGFLGQPTRSRLPLGAGVTGQAVASGRPRVVHGRERILSELFPDALSHLEAEGFETFAATPMKVRGALVGALVAAQRSPFEASPDWLEFFGAVATQGGILVDNSTLLSDLKARNAELRAAYDDTIEGWSRALDLRDRETEGHSRRVTDLTLRLAQAMGLAEEKLLHLRRGALLHDIGKMGVPDSILQKPGALGDDEWAVMRRHTVFARDLLAPITFLGPALEIPFSHHERWDGTGYPDGLAGEAIPLAARMFAIADVYDALTSDRPYRPAWTREKALEHIEAGRGNHFDPAVVDAFVRLLET